MRALTGTTRNNAPVPTLRLNTCSAGVEVAAREAERGRRAHVPPRGQLLGVLAFWTRTVFRRIVVIAAIATMAAMPANEAGKQPQGSTAPFEGLLAVDGIVTSNDDYSIWLTWQSEHFRIRYPDGRPAFEQPSNGTGDLVAMLDFHLSRGPPRRGTVGTVTGDGGV